MIRCGVCRRRRFLAVMSLPILPARTSGQQIRTTTGPLREAHLTCRLLFQQSDYWFTGPAVTAKVLRVPDANTRLKKLVANLTGVDNSSGQV